MLRAPHWMFEDAPSGFAEDLAAWETRAVQALAGRPDFQSQFLASPRIEALVHPLTARLKHQLAVLAIAGYGGAITGSGWI
jgi:hypothetical protein